MKKMFLMLVVMFLAVAANAGSKESAVVKQFGVPALSMIDFNRLAFASGINLFWNADKNNSRTIEPSELISVGAGSSLAPYVEGGKFTDTFKNAYLKLVDAKRAEVVRQELDQSRPAILVSDFRNLPSNDKKVVEHIVAASKIIEELYGKQKGSLQYLPKIPKSDSLSLALFYRNQGPWCDAPRTQSNQFCSALDSFPEKISDAYPQDMKQDEKMCEDIKKGPNGKELLSPFTVVRRDGGKLVAWPLTAVYGEQMKLVADELKAAADLVDAKEAAFKKYLLAAAKGFETNNWDEADETWVAMNSRNSKWYLRIAPDETYFDPCQEKAGFHTSFAKIDPSSLKWQDSLNPIKQEMENNLANLIGPSYKAREVAFNFPDFIEMILNAGDSRPSRGATIGQSLPNWGKVAEENRRRTVVMTNFYTDPESKRVARETAGLLLDNASMTNFSDEKEPGIVGVILHEAAHNFGPHSDYKVDGKSPSDLFGGRTSATLEELKAQTAALWYVDYIRKKGLVSEKLAKEIYTHEIAWCFGHIAKGMFTASGVPNNYSQLAAIQVGSLVNGGALEFVTTEGTEKDVGRFKINFDKLPKASELLMQKVSTILATGDAKGAKEFIDNYTVGEGSKFVRMDDVKDRVLRFPKASFEYAVLY